MTKRKEEEVGLSRRDLMKTSVKLVVWGAGVSSVLTACGGKKSSELDCTDTSGLSGPDLTMRNTLKYVDRSPDPQKLCSNCMFFNPPAQQGCGGCKLIKGPINPKGYCTSWAAKPT